MRYLLMSWSSGKDSAWALHELQQRTDVEVIGLVTTINEEADRVAMHAVRRSLLEAQAEAAGLPLYAVPLPHPCSNAEYEAAMHAHFAHARRLGADGIAYGDLALEDVRTYRETLMADSGLAPEFPLWARDTGELAQRMVDAGLRACLTCVDPKQMPACYAGRVFDAALLAELPPGIDACGENGEFHTFATHGPMFTRGIDVQRGETVERDGLVFCDFRPGPAPAA